MTREDAKILLPIIAAYAEGKTIEYSSPISRKWEIVNPGTTANFSAPPEQYRIQVLPRETFRIEFPDGLLATIAFNAEESARKYAETNYTGGEVRIVKFLEQIPV